MKDVPACRRAGVQRVAYRRAGVQEAKKLCFRATFVSANVFEGYVCVVCQHSLVYLTLQYQDQPANNKIGSFTKFEVHNVV